MEIAKPKSVPEYHAREALAAGGPENDWLLRYLWVISTASKHTQNFTYTLTFS